MELSVGRGVSLSIEAIHVTVGPWTKCPSSDASTSIDKADKTKHRTQQQHTKGLKPKQTRVDMEQAEHVIAELVTGIVLLMILAAVTNIASKKITKLPFTIALVFVGMFFALGSDHIPGLESLKAFHLTPELVLFVFIPTLVFETAFKLDVRLVGRNLLPIIVLAVPGLLLSTAIIGLLMAWLTPFSLPVALLLGAILSATDPVAVIAIFKQLGVPERLTILVEGESLFNDATALVLATLLLGILSTSGPSGTETATEMLVAGTTEFIIVFVGGALVGWLMAVVVGFTLGRIESDPLIEITLTTILAYFSFVVASQVFQVSGIMAVVAAGMTIGSWGRTKISPSTELFMKRFWEYLAYLANALIFLMVGLQIDLAALWASADLIGYVVLAMLVSRFVVIYGVVPLLGRLPGSEPITQPFRHVMYWGGLRGAIALAIVLSLPDANYKDTLVTVVMGAVLFTLVVQGLSMEWLVKRLGLNRRSMADNLAHLESDSVAREQGLISLDRLAADGLFSQPVAETLRQRTEAELQVLHQEIAGLHSHMTDTERLKILTLRCLAREKLFYHELFSLGLVNEHAYRELAYTVIIQQDEVRHRDIMPSSTIAPSLGQRFSRLLLKLPALLPGVQGLRDRQVIRDYEIAWGRHRAATAVLENLTEWRLEEPDNSAFVDRLVRVYKLILQEVQQHIELVTARHPELVEAVQAQLGRQLLLIAEHDAVEQAAASGMLHAGIAGQIMESQQAHLHHLKHSRRT